MKSNFHIRKATPKDTVAIMSLINAESDRSGAVLKVTDVTVKAWIKNKLSLLTTTKEGEIIAHISGYLWPQSGWIELRASVVKPEFRGQGISSTLMKKMLRAIKLKYGKRTLVAFTNKAGKGKGILIALGFLQAEYETLPKELFTIGPHYRGKKEYGYKIFVLA